MEISGKELDYQMYCHGCSVSGRSESKDEFETGYANGQFHFHTDKALLLDLLETYKVNIQFLAQEWLASNTRASAWGETPLEAACRLILILSRK